MKNFNLKMALAALCLMSFTAAFTKIEAGPVRFDQVLQIMNARPSKAANGDFERLAIATYYNGFVVGDDDDEKKKGSPQQDGRVITETRTDIVEDDVCDCIQPDVVHRFPKWALLGLAAIPIAFILIRKHEPTPTPTTPTPTPTPTTPTPTPTTPTPTPTTPTPTPTTPTPTPPQAVPEPMTLLLFGTGLASIGLAARRRYGKKAKEGSGDIE